MGGRGNSSYNWTMKVRVEMLFLPNSYLPTGFFLTGRRTDRGRCEQGNKSTVLQIHPTTTTTTPTPRRVHLDKGEQEYANNRGAKRTWRTEGQRGLRDLTADKEREENRLQEITQQAREEKEGSWRSGRRGVEDSKYNRAAKRTWRTEGQRGLRDLTADKEREENHLQEITQQAREEKEESWRSGRRGVEDSKSGNEGEKTDVTGNQRTGG
ncbi:hypothetical protein Fot_29073 [Forsythia ovata]|uniref:Uncharacterized protein n=1 Tax=Forsythia ovata TaxID=205694 RepID=A0ABD1TQX9_9LAMI